MIIEIEGVDHAVENFRIAMYCLFSSILNFFVEVSDGRRVAAQASLPLNGERGGGGRYPSDR